VNSIVSVGLGVFTGWLPKFHIAGDTLVGTNPVPLRLTVCCEEVLLLELSEIVTVAESGVAA